ncbi:MAG: bifunctional riboflavin kinase/FAD synthetase [Proteobacteria bacterium]|nr:bifunctional riboflavin kinase/FAD synthetase [Pseudomonadota bacterium]MDA1022470.1 bifunctional riboflavin kinase/FAD synthetase [Pseudomonadota bacterium]
MRIFRHFNALPDDAKGAAVAVGNFDGVHKGHQAVIHEAGVIAKDTTRDVTGDGKRPWAVLTFEPHPRKLFAPDQPPFRLTPFAAKAEAIEAMGVDLLIVQRFDTAFSQMEAKDFVIEALVGGLNASHVVAGYDFVFGYKRSGHCDMLLAMGREHNFGFTAVNAVEDGTGQVYSSTRVRDCLANGDLDGAKALLGRDFQYRGRVMHGQRRGHTIGFPTANIALGQAVCPRLGVYAIRAQAGGCGEWRDGVANIGVRPTFGGDGVVLEVHLFDFDGDLYGQRMHVRLIGFLRDEKKFDGIGDLKTQIALDVTKAMEILTV